MKEFLVSPEMIRFYKVSGVMLAILVPFFWWWYSADGIAVEVARVIFTACGVYFLVDKFDNLVNWAVDRWWP